MERIAKGGEEETEKQEFLGIKLKRGILVGKRGGPCTPVPAWKLEDAQDNTIKGPLTLPSTVSARKLGANLWEIQQHHPLPRMSKGGARLRHHKDKHLELPMHLVDPSHSPPDQPESASSLRRHVAVSLMQHHQSIEMNACALQPLSPASYCSSMEVAAYNPPLTPTSSLDIKGRVGESGYSLKTSTELLKVLNRIWSLEEQHASSISLVKALKIELDHARTRIKELLKEQQTDRHEMDELMKQIVEEKLVRKSKEQDRIKAAVQSVRDELEDERKLRKHSENLHRKLARELSEVKTAFSKALKELEREGKARALLEDLCDEFARGIGDYDQEVRSLKHKFDMDHNDRNGHDRLILHISEAWLDERMQMKLSEVQSGLAEKNTIVDKLSFEIETFLQAKRSGSSKSNDILFAKDPNCTLHRHSLESIHLNEATSAPQDVGDEDSVSCDSHCFELNKVVGNKKNNGFSKPNAEENLRDVDKTTKCYPNKKKLGSHERTKGSQVQLEEQMPWAASCNGNTTLMDGESMKVGEDASLVEISISRKSEICEDTEDGNQERKSKRDEIRRSNSNNVVDNLTGNPSLLGGKFGPENDCKEEPCSESICKGHASPVQQWISRFASPDLEISELSSKWPRGFKGNTLKEKLLEARLEGQHSRLKASSKGSS
ncbi:PREDICTED: uncharacterized protein At5g41620 [Nelumbo nucifera]|uniref:Uncharacterized protein At5g41620 n=1 Tax=Nelumbo nucifera TaxID=4432 RepID=A0A1U8A324_NELNU|nr:PREDICTED: uncharacterized protein At5g41620 [Nelumbo nucifera]